MSFFFKKKPDNAATKHVKHFHGESRLGVARLVTSAEAIALFAAGSRPRPVFAVAAATGPRTGGEKKRRGFGPASLGPERGGGGGLDGTDPARFQGFPEPPGGFIKTKGGGRGGGGGSSCRSAAEQSEREGNCSVSCGQKALAVFVTCVFLCRPADLSDSSVSFHLM